MTKQLEQLTPDTPATLQYTPEFQTTEFVIRGDHDVVVVVDEQLTALEAGLLKAQPVTPVEPPKTAPKPELAYINMSELPKAEIVRMKAKSFLYDKIHGTTMLSLLNERIADDRNVAFATRLGLLSMNDTYCRKHQAAVAKLGKLAN